MAVDFNTALAEFAATAAALNARALRRAGLLDDFELGVMDTFLDFVEDHAAGDGERLSIVRSLRDCLPKDADQPG
ncbi:hypothetical protein [Sphingomonas leidyi]|jgi:hypothetical protein|uniref:hypothetical protein n=1 Tax=Sphingomonas leidyi TaxID=68569 RepID=UPI0036D37C82